PALHLRPPPFPTRRSSDLPAATAPPAAPSARGPRPAPALRRVLAHAGLETRVLLSNGEQLTVAVALPAMVLIGLWLLPLGRIPGDRKSTRLNSSHVKISYA